MTATESSPSLGSILKIAGVGGCVVGGTLMGGPVIGVVGGAAGLTVLAINAICKEKNVRSVEENSATAVGLLISCTISLISTVVFQNASSSECGKMHQNSDSNFFQATCYGSSALYYVSIASVIYFIGSAAIWKFFR